MILAYNVFWPFTGLTQCYMAIKTGSTKKKDSSTDPGGRRDQGILLPDARPGDFGNVNTDIFRFPIPGVDRRDRAPRQTPVRTNSLFVWDAVEAAIARTASLEGVEFAEAQAAAQAATGPRC